MSLRLRVLVLLGLLMAINLAGAGVTLYYARQTRDFYANRLSRQMDSLMAAQELESALAAQKGLTTYFFLSGEEKWLTALGKGQDKVMRAMAEARTTVRSPEAREFLADLSERYQHYSRERDRVLALYLSGSREDGAQLHWQVRDAFEQVMEASRTYTHTVRDTVRDTGRLYESRAGSVSLLAWVSVPVQAVLGLLMGLVLFRNILGPIRRLAGFDEKGPGRGDEVMALSLRFNNLLSDVDHFQSELKESREIIVQSEKLALLGKLAAGVAHTIRNPLTSVKMRLFSLERHLELGPVQKEDFEVIAEEIANIDSIVRSFLEFSRPPRLTLRRVAVSEIVDAAVRLLKHKFEFCNVTVKIERRDEPPEVKADPDQIREVLVNLLVNGCDAMPAGGELTIVEEVGVTEPQGRVAIVRISDSGPGIPEAIRERVFEPFFSTKGEGTGLGLPIAKRIMQEHGGWLHLHSPAGSGATFVLAFPLEPSQVKGLSSRMERSVVV